MWFSHLLIAVYVRVCLFFSSFSIRILFTYDLLWIYVCVLLCDFLSFCGIKLLLVCFFVCLFLILFEVTENWRWTEDFGLSELDISVDFQIYDRVRSFCLMTSHITTVFRQITELSSTYRWFAEYILIACKIL